MGPGRRGPRRTLFQGRLLDLPGAPATLAVERYDRAAGPDGGVMRLHQEDACQALGLPASGKYAAEASPKGDDPTYRGVAALLSRFAQDADHELDELLRQLVVNLALGNRDAHAKNLSLLYARPMCPGVAPLYDMVPVAEVEPRTTLLSMRVGGKLDPARVGRCQVLSEAQGWGMPRKRAAEVVDTRLEGATQGGRRTT